METPGNPDFTPKPELDRKNPAEIFSYAREKQRWYKKRVSNDRMVYAVDGLVEELENYISSAYDSMPEIIAVGKDVSSTHNISRNGPNIIIENGPMPLEGDAALYEEHEIRGTLYGFHQGDKGDLRVYISTGEEPRAYMGGIITPLVSVAVESTDIKLAEISVAEKIEELEITIAEQLSVYSSEVTDAVNNLVNTINDSSGSTVNKLQRTSSIIAGIARHPDTSISFVDTIMELVRTRLHLDSPHDIRTTAYRAVISVNPVSSYKAQGAEEFIGVIPELGLIGETANKGLGLFFLNGETPIQIPVQYITAMHNVDRR